MSFNFKENEEVFPDDAVYYSSDRQTTSWIIDKCNCRIQSSRPKITEQVSSWSFAKEVGRDIAGPTRIYSIPRRKWRWALKKLGIESPQKNLTRVVMGLKVGRQNLKQGAEGPGQKNLKPTRAEFFKKQGQGKVHDDRRL